MKLIVLISTTLFATAALACLGEVQFIATVKSNQIVSKQHCKVFIDELSVRSDSTNLNCPLDIMDVKNEGILFQLVNGHDCPVGANDDISGVAVRLPNGTIILE